MSGLPDCSLCSVSKFVLMPRQKLKQKIQYYMYVMCDEKFYLFFILRAAVCASKAMALVNHLRHARHVGDTNSLGVTCIGSLYAWVWTFEISNWENKGITLRGARNYGDCLTKSTATHVRCVRTPPPALKQVRSFGLKGVFLASLSCNLANMW